MKRVTVFFEGKEVQSFFYGTEKERMFFIGGKLVADFSKGDYAFYFSQSNIKIDTEEIKKEIKKKNTIFFWDL